VKLHRQGQPPDEWEIHELEPARDADGRHNGPRMKAEWVVDMTIDRIVVEHKHEIFRQNVKILDVPGCVESLLVPAAFLTTRSC
jgi:hypothetical protein